MLEEEILVLHSEGNYQLVSLAVETSKMIRFLDDLSYYGTKPLQPGKQNELIIK